MELCAELELATERFDRQEERAHRDAGFGAGVRGLAIAQRWLAPLVAHLKVLLEDHSPIAMVLRELEPEVLGVCLLQSVIHAIASGSTAILDLTLFLGEQVRAECWAAGLLRYDSRLAKRVEKAVKSRHGSVRYRRQAARSMAAREGYRAPRWSSVQKVRVGEWALNALRTALPDAFVFEPAVKLGRGKSRPGYVTFSAEAMQHADEAVAAAVLAHPVWLPVIEPPAPWTSDVCSMGACERGLVRTRNKVTARAVKQAVAAGRMQPVLDAVNALQSVAWAINEPVLRFQQWVWHSGIKFPGFPPRDELPAPAHGPWDEMSEDERKAWKLRASAVAKDNRTYRTDRLSVLEDLHTALDLKRSPRFYTTMNLDWRGRVYPMPHFNYQREDRVRALFLFADGEPIGEQGLYWLKVHLANLSDGLSERWSKVKISKQSFQERVQWVDNCLPTIAWIAMVAFQMNEPQLAVGYLSLLDEPFLWLAAALELRSALAAGSNYITRLPVAFDGSCSGLQHLCAMTRAPEGSLVNLTPSERPQDVYQVVADRVAATVSREAAEAGTATAELAQLSEAYGITRSLVKRNVMTYSYSSKQYGMTEQLREDTMEPLRRKVTLGELAEHPFKDQAGKAAAYLARITYAAIEEVVHLPAQAMAFLQKLAKALAHEGKPLRWTTPVGLPWINRYAEPVTKQVKLWLHDRGVRVRYDVLIATGEERGIDKDQAANGVAPNFVHALDAAHLLRVVHAANAVGIGALATVHDSFGCLASRGGVLRDVIRREFVRMYTEHDPLREILASAKQDLTEANHDKLPELPQYGQLDINEVINADYCFA